MPAQNLPEFEQALTAALSKVDTDLQNGGQVQRGLRAPVHPDGTPMTQFEQFQEVQRTGQPFAEPGLGDPTYLDSVVAGVGSAALETKDFVVGEPTFDEKSETRKLFERGANAVASRGADEALVMGISQFATGMIGLGKITAPLKGIKSLKAATNLGKAVQQSAKAAAAGSVVFDPHQERLSNLALQYPVLNNPITRFLAADPNDSAAEGRFKSALESIGLDAAIGGVLLASTKVLRALKSGDNAAANLAAQEAEVALTKAETVEIGADLFDAPMPSAATEPKPVVGTPANSNGPVKPVANDNSAAMLAQGNGPPIPVPGGGGDVVALPQPMNPNVRPSTGSAANVNDVAQPPTGLRNDNVAPPSPSPAPVTVGDFFETATKSSSEARQPGGSVPASGSRSIPINGGSVPETPLAATGGAIDVVPNMTKGLEGADAVKPQRGTIPIEEAQAQSILKRIPKDVAAIVKHGSRDNALEAGYKFGHQDTIPWQKLNTPDDLTAFIGNMAEEVRGNLDKLKGGAVLTDKRLERLIDQRLELYGDDPVAARGIFQRAGKEAVGLAANMEAADAVAVKMADEAYRVANMIRLGNLGPWGGDAQAAMAEFVKRAGLAMEVFGASRSMLSNAARTVRRARGDLPRLSFKEIQALKGMDAQTLLKVIQGTNGDVKALKNALAKPSILAKATDAASYLMVNNLLWGWKTHVVNLSTNVYMMGARPAERIIGSFAVRGGSAIRTQALREYRYTVANLADSFSMASRTFLEGDSILAPHQVELHAVGNRSGVGSAFRPVRSVGDLGYNALTGVMKAIGFPTRALGTVDELIKQVRYRASVMAEGSMLADDLGLDGKAYRDYVSRYLDEAFDSEGRAINERALREAKITTFSQELDPKGIGSTVQNAVVKHPALRLILPFVRTPTNVLKYGIKLTPGLNMVQREFRDAIRGALGVEEQAQAIGQMAIGALFMGAAASLVSEGKFTGSGPSDLKIRQQLLSQGWQPFSLVLENEDKTKTYVPLGKFDPIAMPFGIIADIMDVMQHPEKFNAADGVIMAMGLAVAKQVGDKTYLMNLRQFLEAVTDPDAKAEKFVGRLAGNLVPFASLLKQSNPDDYLREARGIADSILATTPGLSDKLPPRYDAFGDPISVRRGLSTTDEAIIVERELTRMGMETGKGIAPPPPNQKGADLRDITLEDGRNAYAVYQEYAGHPPSGPSLKASLAKVIKSPAYQKAPDGDSGTKGTRQAILRDIVGKYREAAMKRLLRESATVRDAVFQAELKVRGAYLEGRAKAPTAGPLQALAESYGVDLSSITQPR
jgi:hypothetical protein